MYSTTTLKSRNSTYHQAKKPISQAKISFKPSKANTLRVLIDKGILLHSITITHQQIADLKMHYKRSGTDCSSDEVCLNLRDLKNEGVLEVKKGAFRKPNTYTITSFGREVARWLLDNDDLDSYNGPLKNNKKDIKNSTCNRERACVKREIKQFKRMNFYAVILSQVQKALHLTPRGMANYLQFDDDALRALLKEKIFHGKDKTKQAKEFCRLHMLERDFFPDIDVVYRTWRKIDKENNGIRMPLFLLKETYFDYKDKVLEGARWFFRKGTKSLPFSDVFSPFYSEYLKRKKKLREKESACLSQPSEQIKSIYRESLSWKRCPAGSWLKSQTLVY